MREGRMAMENAKVRINKITLWDIKSVSYGVINLNAGDLFHQEKSSIMGLYGQNASGKTVVIEALAIIKYVMSGHKIPQHYLEIISNGKDECSIEIEFLIANEEYNFDCTARYKCTLARRNDPNESDENPKKIIAVIRERLRARGTDNGEKFILQDIAQTDESCPLILPTEKRDLLFGKDQLALKSLEQQKILALYGSRSFIFSAQARKAIMQATHKEVNSVWPQILLMCLIRYMHNCFFVIDELTVRNLDFHIMKKFGTFDVPINIPSLLSNSIGASNINVPKELVDDIEALLPHLNHIISSIVPGLGLEYECEKVSLGGGDDRYSVELFSHREGLGIFPFRNESLGIKKIVSFIVLLAEAYNNPSFTLAIDEMDASIFEYLLGEILDIMGNSGKGQLLFTSHNLRPLERLAPRFVWFTTTDPSNRYVQINKKATNNLRDMYLRAIQLGHEDKELYSGDSKHALAYAFRKMGRNK